jgi:hypothetical protein
MISSDSPPKPATGYVGLAQRIRRRTTDLLAIGLVVVATLTIGRQTVVWWNTEPPPPLAPDLQTGSFLQGDSRAPVLLEFGNQPVSLTRQIIGGGRLQALEKLVSLCRTACQTAISPPQLIAPVEPKLLAQLESRQPFEEVLNQWRLYQLDDALPMIVGIRRFGSRSSPSGREPRREQPAAATVIDKSWRLVCWGLAMPLSDKSWTLYVHAASSMPVAADAVSGPIPELPPESRRILSLRQPGGGQMIGFCGSGTVPGWSGFYDRWTRDHGWQKLEGRPASRQSYSARYQSATAGDTLELQLMSGGAGEVRGLLSVWPPTP